MFRHVAADSEKLSGEDRLGCETAKAGLIEVDAGYARAGGSVIVAVSGEDDGKSHQRIQCARKPCRASMSRARRVAPAAAAMLALRGAQARKEQLCPVQGLSRQHSPPC
jgi:hypothetical protein